MSALSIQVPFPVFQDRDGQPLENGFVFLGVANLNPQTNPVIAYFDDALTIVAPQPLRTLNGFISRAGTPAQVYIDGVDFSILVQDSKGSVVYNFPEATGIEPNAAGIDYNPDDDSLLFPGGTITVKSALDQITDKDNGSAFVGFNQPAAGAVSRSAEAKLRDSISVQDFGAVGDGVTDDGAAFALAIAAANGKVLNLNGLTYLIKTAVDVTVSDGIRIINGNLLYDFDTQQERGVRITSPGNITISNVSIDGQNTAAKLLLLRATGLEATAFVVNYFGQNAFQEFGTTGLASAIQFDRVSSTVDAYKTVQVINSRVQNVNSSDLENGVGRGIYIEEAFNTIISNCNVENIGPHGDGDGIFAISTEDIKNKSFTVDNCVFKNCQKRSIKSQIFNTRVSNVVCRRTVDFITAPGQCEISLQDGGVVDGASFYYADGCFPNQGMVDAIVRNSDSIAEFRNISVVCDDPDNVIDFIVGLFQSNDAVVKNPIIENITVNSFVKYFVTTSGTGVAGFDKSNFVFQNAVFRNITGRGFDPSPATDAISGQLEQGFIQQQRSGTVFIQMTYKANNIRIGSDDAVQSAYLDTSSGNLVRLQAQLTEWHNCDGFDTTTYNGTGEGTFNALPVPEYISPQHILSTVIGVNEGGATSKTFRIFAADNTCKIIVTYAGSDGANRTLFTEGYASSNNITDCRYFETIAGNKNNGVAGTIAIAADAGVNTFTVTKGAGSGGSSGNLMIIIQHVRSVTPV